jgi:hypothetical protein
MYCLSFNILSLLQCSVCPSMYFLSFTMYGLSFNVLSVLQCIVCDNTLKSTDDTLKYRQFIEGQKIHWRTDNTLEGIVCSSMYCLFSSMYCLFSNVLSVLFSVLSVLQCIVCPLQCIHWKKDNTLQDRQ